MSLSKRERVLKTLELDGEPDKVPIHYFGFEQTGTSFQAFSRSIEKQEFTSFVNNRHNNKKYYITEQRFWNLDIFEMDPFGVNKLKIKNIEAPPDFPNSYISVIDGRIFKTVKQVETGMPYEWYVGGYFTSKERVNELWDRYGKPSERINDRINYSPQIWEGFVEAVSPYFYPMVYTPLNPTECLFEGVTMARVAYFMRKDPQFIHMLMDEYTKVDIEIIKRLNEAGVDIVFMGDDLGYKENPIFSLKQYNEFILPYHKKLFQKCKKFGMLSVLHSCGKIDQYVPDLIKAGLNCLQALEVTAGVDLKNLKKHYGDKICFMGGLDSSGILTFGTPEQVFEHVKNTLKIGGKGGGYFVGPSHDILNIPWENILAMRSAIEKYRDYPFN
ncbi:MAG: Methylated-thiol--coenzyme M methyltransferase [Promethearchaeota archaeon]|nr:MAG: Methylated-thiol--coenzyme M methyltransferase [Candidatus Lokiarchaeota archaeon]